MIPDSCSCKEAYQNAAYWNQFSNIEEMDYENTTPEVERGETGVSPAIENDETSSGLYDLQGRPVDGTQRGILIRNGKKMLVK